MAIATAAGAATPDSITAITFNSGNSGGVSLGYFGTGASGSFTITGTFADDGGNATVSSSAPGLTFSSVTRQQHGPYHRKLHVHVFNGGWKLQPHGDRRQRNCDELISRNG